VEDLRGLAGPRPSLLEDVGCGLLLRVVGSRVSAAKSLEQVRRANGFSPFDPGDCIEQLALFLGRGSGR
jgi:hypothetical protein